MARTLATQPRLLLLDEVLAGLNPREVEEAIPLILSLNSQRKTSLLLIEHNLRAVMGICQRLLVEGYFPDYVGTIKDAKILNLPVKAYVGAWGIGTPEFVRELGPMSEYIYGTSIWEMGTASKEAKKEEAEIVASYKARFKEDPSYIAMLGYLSAKYMLEAIVQGGGQTGSYSSEKTRNALRALDTVGPLGRVAFDEKGDPRFFTAVLFQTQKGEQVVVYPKERATGSVQYPAVPWGGK